MVLNFLLTWFGLTSQRYDKKVSDYPTHKDAEEKLDPFGIFNVWLSFNDCVARSEFNTKEIGNFLITK